jgi:hypothetical protein
MVEFDPNALPSARFSPRHCGVGAWTEHIFFAYDLVEVLRPKVLIELGTDRGESYFAFCQSALENETGTKCFAVDHWRGDAHAGSYDETTFAQVTAQNAVHYATFSTLLRMNFDQASARFAPESINLLHIDGHHTEEAARHDVDAWLPKLRPGGILLLHDIATRARDFGVWRVWEELQRNGRSFAFTQLPGLGVWQKPPMTSLPPLLKILFASPNEKSNAVRGHYERHYRKLQKRIEEQWRDGSIRAAPMAAETIIQIFWSTDGNFSEDRSVHTRIGHDAWKNVSVPLPQQESAARLRVDFYSALTKIEIAEIAVENSGAEVLRLTTAADFEKVSLGGDCVRCSLAPFVLQITGVDPQLYLPEFAPVSGCELLVRLRLRVGL